MPEPRRAAGTGTRAGAGIATRTGSSQDYSALILRACIGSRQVPQGMVGSARAELIDAADLVALPRNG